MKTMKCAWCGKVLTLTKSGERPVQHLNGKTTCPGSGQLVTTHLRLRATAQQAAAKKHSFELRIDSILSSS